MQLYTFNPTRHRTGAVPQSVKGLPRWACSRPRLAPRAAPLRGRGPCVPGIIDGRAAGLRAKNHLSSQQHQQHPQQQQQQHVPLRLPPWWNTGLAGALLSAKRNAATTVGQDVSDDHKQGRGSVGEESREEGHAQHSKAAYPVGSMSSTELEASEEEEEAEESEEEGAGYGLHHHANTAFQYSYRSDSSSLDTVEEDVPLFSWPSGDVDGMPASAAGAAMSAHSLTKSNYAASAEQASGSSNLPKAYALPADTLKHQVLRLEPNGKTRRFNVRRRDLLREHKLQPRDLRRIDPAIDFTKTSPSITVKENALLLCLGGVRAIVTAEKALLFEPDSPATQRFIETMVPHLESKNKLREASSLSKGGTVVPASDLAREAALVQASHSEYMARFQLKNKPGSIRMPPFELEMLEGALIVATGFVDAELSRVSKRVQELLTKLPHDINPKGLEELRKVKTALVEAEDRTDTLRNMLEELMDDEDELREMNLLSRPRREERRRQRERERLERELERAREIKEELEDRLEEDEQAGGQYGASKEPDAPLAKGIQYAPSYYVDPSGKGYASWTGGAGPALDQPLPSVSDNGTGGSPPSSLPGNGSASSSKEERQGRLNALRSKFDRERIALLKSTLQSGGDVRDLSRLSPAVRKAAMDAGLGREPHHHHRRHHHNHNHHHLGRSHHLHHHHHHLGRHQTSNHTMSARDKSLAREREKLERELERAERLERLRLARSNAGENDGDWINRLEAQLEGSEEDIMEAQEALEEMMEQEEEEYEVEEVEDLMEYYLQRASAAQSEAERLLAGARDLEESIGVSLSARRFEVNRLELTLSIASFAAAIGAVVAGIFGMNMRSMMENSIMGFWGVACLIIFGCTFLFFTILRYTRRKRIL